MRPGRRDLLPLAGRAVAAAAVLLLAACGSGPEPAPPSARSTPVASPAFVGRAASGPAPLRDLSRDEARGGHTLARHVGLSDAQLRERLRREPRISAASTYTDRPTAERVVGAALAAGRERIEGWRAREGRRPNLVLDYRSPDGPVGRSLRRRASASVPCAEAVVVLRWDEGSGDFFVLTSYPEARR